MVHSVLQVTSLYIINVLYEWSPTLILILIFILFFSNIQICIIMYHLCIYAKYINCMWSCQKTSVISTCLSSERDHKKE